MKYFSTDLTGDIITLMNDLTVVVPTMNNEKGLKYLVSYFKDKSSRLIVIDNKPTYDKKYLLRMVRSKIKPLYLPQNKNLGFAAAVNLGATYAKTKWLLILNDDIVFKDDKVLSSLIDEAKKRKLDSLSPVLRNPDGKVENYGYRVLPPGKVELVKDLEDKKIDGLTAACLLIKTDVFKHLKGFDESFFAYLEDVDFFLRFKKKGYRMGISKLEVKHNHMTTSKTMGNFKARQDLINWWRISLKNKEYFDFNATFFIERLRNLSGFIKATLSK